MAEINISTGDLRSLASNMMYWAEEMASISSDMNNKAHNMTDWTDKRAEQFCEVASSTAEQLDILIDNFKEMSKFLAKYAEHQEAAERAQNTRMSNLI